MRRERVVACGLCLFGGCFMWMIACSSPPPTPATPSNKPATFDIEIDDDSTQTIAFGQNILPGQADYLWVNNVNADLGLTPLISLAPQFAFSTVGVTARFRSPFANTQVIPGLDASQCPTAPQKDGCHFTSDAELELFTRDPTELYRTLINDPHAGLTFLQDMSTARLFPTGEQSGLLDPTPFTLPDVVVINVTDAPLTIRNGCSLKTGCGGVTLFNQPELNPVNSTWFWFNNNLSDPNLIGGGVASSLWGTPANLPLGLGSVKGARLLQHGRASSR